MDLLRLRWTRVVASACWATVVACSSAEPDGRQPMAAESTNRPTSPASPATDGEVTASISTATGNSSQAPALAAIPPPVSTVQTVPMDDAAPTDEPIAIQACDPPSAPVTTEQVEALRNPQSTANTRLLYPYDGTIVPRGMIGPLLMWEGPAAEAVRLRIVATDFEYEACLPPSGTNQLQVPQDIWDLAGRRTQGRQHPFRVEVSGVADGEAYGPLSIEVIIAQATIKGSIYYNSYSSRFATLGAAVLRIPAGKEVEPFASTECVGCHSVSANGARMVAQTGTLGGRSYQLSPGVGANPPAMNPGLRAAYGALYPDGSRFITTSTVTEVARTKFSSPLADDQARMFETDTGVEVAMAGVPTHAMMPSFSVDGQWLAFTDFDVSAGAALSMVKFDVTSNSGSNYRMLFQDQGSTRPAWPFFLPDNGGIVVARTDSPDFTGGAAGLIPGLPLGPYGELFVVDIASGQVTLLARAMGYASESDAAAGNTYLPFGAADVGKNYYPTVSPVAAGGYFWLFFDAVRNYGNLGTQRQLWGTALEISPDGTYTSDRSAPAFYLPGQEFGTGNHRAFAALDPCHQEGDSCTSGIDCCGGFCKIEEPVGEFAGEPVGTCSPKENPCAGRDEGCVTDQDCCNEPGQAVATCIAGFCAELLLE